MKPYMTPDEWHDLLESKEIEDISSELPQGYLLYCQLMDALVRYRGKKYRVVAWNRCGFVYITSEIHPDII